MRSDYETWLRAQGYDETTIRNQLSFVRRVERHYGDLDGHDDRGFEALVAELTYTSEDERQKRANPSKIPFEGDTRSNLASYRNAALRYRRYRESGEPRSVASVTASPPPRTAASIPPSRPPRRATTKIPFEPRTAARTLVDFNLDGRAALEAIVAASQYLTIAQAVASLTLFSHPETVRQTGGRAVFRAVRNPRRVGQFDAHDGVRVLLDDNKSPTDAFLWANGLARRGADTQFNHVYAASLDVDAYTALPNICMTPAFIAKLTDTSEGVRALLKYRSFQLYGWTPSHHPEPERAADYEVLEWAAPLPPVADVRGAIERAMATKPKDRTVIAAREIGWLFG